MKNKNYIRLQNTNFLYLGMNLHEKALKLLRRIPKGTSMPIDELAKKDPNLLISVTKELIDRGYSEFYFSECYTKIHRMHTIKDYFSLDYLKNE